MNILYYIGRLLFSAGMSTAVSITIAVISLIILSLVVDLLRLNYKGNTYWVLKVCCINFCISWIISFYYYAMVLK